MSRKDYKNIFNFKFGFFSRNNTFWFLSTAVMCEKNDERKLKGESPLIIKWPWGQNYGAIVI